MTSPAEEIRELAARALEDSRAEQQTAHDALICARVYLDKYHELTALAARIDAGGPEAKLFA